MSIIVCRPRSLPLEKLAQAERRAVEINPANAGDRRSVERSPKGRRGGPRRLAVLVARKWPASGVRLSVSFMDNPSKALRSRILSHMNAWAKTATVRFSETASNGQVRIARFDSPPNMAGYWSYIGTEILEIEEDEATLNLEGFTMKTSDAEFRRVVRHEAGHTLGFEHEHMRSDLVSRIDRRKAIAYFDREDGWTPDEVEQQVLTPLAKHSIMGTKESDPLSIMCYQLPAEIMKDRKAIRGGADINPTDYEFAGSLYPKKGQFHAGTPMEDKERDTAPTPPSFGPPRDEDFADTFQLVIMDEFRADGSTQSGVRGSKYSQVFASYGGARVTSVMQMRADAGEGRTRFGKIIAVHQRIKKYTNQEVGSLPNDNDLVGFGVDLFDTLFQGDVRRLYDEARARQRRRRLDLVLTSMIPWIAEKPWEFAYDGGRRSFVATEDIHFIRNVLTNVPADPVIRASGPLRILVASAQPIGMGRLSIDQEVAVIRRGFEPLIDAGHVTVEVLARATPSALHGYLSTGDYQIVHFIGHGVFDEEKREGCLIFVDDRGNQYPLGERSVRELFGGRGLSLVFLNACESGRGGRADFNKGVAQSLVAHGLPALVANQYSVLDSSATSFAQNFYWSLAQGLSVGEAAREARIAVNYSLHGEPIDWAIPVVYARDAGMTLATAPTARSRAPQTHVRPAAHRATEAHESRIAVWDIDNVFPSLDRTLQGMNAAQSTFGFELTDLSVPLGVREFDKTEGETYLRADKLAHRLQSMPMELGVDILACVTSHYMRDDEWLNLYGWWPDGGKPPILVFSVAGFEELPPEGPKTDRAIANVMVAGLTGFYGNFDTHKRNPQNCPLAFNEDRELEYLINRQTFDAQCRKRVKAKLGTKLRAFEKLLTLF